MHNAYNVKQIVIICCMRMKIGTINIFCTIHLSNYSFYTASIVQRIDLAGAYYD